MESKEEMRKETEEEQKKKVRFRDKNRFFFPVYSDYEGLYAFLWTLLFKRPATVYHRTPHLISCSGCLSPCGHPSSSTGELPVTPSSPPPLAQ